MESMLKLISCTVEDCRSPQLQQSSWTLRLAGCQDCQH